MDLTCFLSFYMFHCTYFFNAFLFSAADYLPTLFCFFCFVCFFLLSLPSFLFTLLHKLGVFMATVALSFVVDDRSAYIVKPCPRAGYTGIIWYGFVYIVMSMDVTHAQVSTVLFNSQCISVG